MGSVPREEESRHHAQGTSRAEFLLSTSSRHSRRIEDQEENMRGASCSADRRLTPKPIYFLTIRPGNATPFT
ncbi:hypothetical protein PRIPAC_78829 [Pristionchus pacificus]|nr:hypothetical protein PRIPAC_78829 [Pristionchus pacificus]